MARQQSGLAAWLLIAGGLLLASCCAARADGFAYRRLLQNPDLPQQRSGTPSWMSGGGGNNNHQGTSQPSSQQSTPAPSQPSPAPSQPSPAQSSSGAPVTIYSGGQFASGWKDSSYNVRPFTSYSPAGHTTGVAKCYYLPFGAATSFYGPQGAFSGRSALEFWAYAGSSSLADVEVVIASSGRDCRHLRISSLSAAESMSGWSKYYIPLSTFSLDQSQASSGSFSGCGSSGPSSGELVKVDIRNPNQSYDALFCLDDVRLL
ncbi:hypothetical protein Agub_g1174 [Astrephomene gubernaculifera]|uniref:MAM domain-containing protein n=1 Tax=Astrephomene gubernaculifera TaxID=47775 RepID=A0AAD3HGL6_9CHLO|nr:hypothetical protein Agub_g1174 [Astrephomene gubernaculifera]